MGLFRSILGPTKKEVRRREFLNDARLTFLERNSAFSRAILNLFLPENNANTPWVISQQKFNADKKVSVFIGYDDLYIFHGVPVNYNKEVEPNTFRSVKIGEHFQRFDYTYTHLSYPDDLSFYPISPYPFQNEWIPESEVLLWIAADIRFKFEAEHPNQNVSELNAVRNPNGDVRYYYFIYEVKYKDLAGWN